MVIEGEEEERTVPVGASRQRLVSSSLWFALGQSQDGESHPCLRVYLVESTSLVSFQRSSNSGCVTDMFERNIKQQEA